MIYFLFGENSYRALRKIREFKEVFTKKNADFLIEKYDGEAEEFGFEKLNFALGQGNLFSKNRLVIFKNILQKDEKILDNLKNNGEFMRASRDIFVFWERVAIAKSLNFFKKYSEKIQETKALLPVELDKWLEAKAKNLGLILNKEERAIMIEEAGEQAEWALEGELEKMVLSGVPAARSENSLTPPAAGTPSPFAFIDKMFGSRAALALKEMSLAGLEPQKFIYAFLWKLKQKKMFDAYFAGIIAESQMRRDPKNAEEILERFIFSIKV